MAVHDRTTDLIRFAGALLEADGTARWQVTRFLFREPGIFRKLGRRYRDWYLPGLHPRDYDNRSKLEQWRQRFR